ncbi:hypothetical protein ACLB2K_046568 [Fragaria x ananassa]
MDQFATLDELDVGVVTTFQPTEEDLLCYYLYNKVFETPFSNYKTFPEICIYGKDGLPPWEIWRLYQQCKFPHQDFIYFFSRAEKLNPNKSRNSRKVGTDGYKWSETETFKSIYVAGNKEAFGSLRKFRYEKNLYKKDKKERDICDEHHGAWLMDEFTINHAPNLALYRLKVNAKGGDRKWKSSAAEKNVEDENLTRRQSSLKKRKREPRRSSDQNSCMSEQQEGTTSQQMPSSYLNENDQVAQVVPENSNNNFHVELEQILMSDDDCVDDENPIFSPAKLSNYDAQLIRASVAQSIAIVHQPHQEQYSDYSVAPQQQLEPENRCQEEYQLQLPQQDQASSSHSNEQELLANNDFD